jgi:L-asparagine oxygenase
MNEGVTMSSAAPVVHQLSPDEKRELEECAVAMRDELGRRLDRQDLDLAVAPYSVRLPADLAAAVRAFRSAPPQSGAFVVKGVDCLEEHRPTPTEYGSFESEMTVGIAALLLVATALGEVISFRNEKSGALVQNVVPVAGYEQAQSNAGSGSALKMHVENAFHEHRPDYVILACVRSDPAEVAGLRIASVMNAVADLPSDVVSALFNDGYATQQPPSFGGAGKVPHAVLSGDADDPNVRVDFAATTVQTADPELAEALDVLEQAIDDHTETLQLEAGDIAMVDNRVALHGRTPFSPSFDGTDRWLHRVYVSLDSRASREARRDNSYVIE